MTKYYIGLEIRQHRIIVFGENRGDAIALTESGFDFVSSPYNTQQEAKDAQDDFAKILTYGGC